MARSCAEVWNARRSFESLNVSKSSTLCSSRERRNAYAMTSKISVGSYDRCLSIDRNFEVLFCGRAGKMVRSVVQEREGEIKKKLRKLGLEAELERFRIIGRAYVSMM
jgi:hypothetical protein